jgi:hypothetical protein
MEGQTIRCPGIGMAPAALEPLYAELAKERQGERTDLKAKANIVADRPQSGKARDQAAKAELTAPNWPLPPAAGVVA